MFHFEHVIYEWMNIVCIVYVLSVMNLHPSSLRAITMVCIFMDGIENIQHFTWMAYLNYTLVMWNRNVGSQFYVWRCVPLLPIQQPEQHFTNALMYYVSTEILNGLYRPHWYNKWIALMRCCYRLRFFVN